MVPHPPVAVLLIGCVCAVPPALCLWLFRDSYALGEASEALPRRCASRGEGVTAESVTAESVTAEGVTFEGVTAEISAISRTPSQQEVTASGVTASGVTAAWPEEQGYGEGGGPQGSCLLRAAHIPALVAASDTLTMVGSGMTVKFFARWFQEDVQTGGARTCGAPACCRSGVGFRERLGSQRHLS